MTTTETDVRRMRLLQIVEVAAPEQIGSQYVLDALRGQHFRVTDEAFQADLAQLDASGFVETSPLDDEVRVTLTGAGRQAIDLVAQPAPPRPVSVDLGRGAHLAIHGPISGRKLDALTAAARVLVDAVLGDPADGDRRPNAHLGAREAS